MRAAGRRHKHDSCELATAVDLFEPSISGVEAISAMQDQIMIRNARFVAGNVVIGNAAFFVFGVVISVSVGESEPPQALIARRAAAVRARAVARGEIFISAT